MQDAISSGKLIFFQPILFYEKKMFSAKKIWENLKAKHVTLFWRTSLIKAFKNPCLQSTLNIYDETNIHGD